MMRHWREYGDIGRRLIRTLPEFEELREAGPRIAYLRSGKEKVRNRRTIYAECCKPDEKYSWCCPYDFFIIVYGPNVERFSDEQMETLIRHELHHCGVEYTDSGVEFYVRSHDVEEFWTIINECGIDWDQDPGCRIQDSEVKYAAGRQSEQSGKSEKRETVQR